MTFCYFNREWLAESLVAVAADDRGFTLGDGVFDTQVSVDGDIRDAAPHFTRLLGDAAILGLPDFSDEEKLADIAQALLTRNGALKGRWTVRTQVTRGAGPRGLLPPQDAAPTILMRLFPSAAPDPRPVTAIIAQTVRRNEHSPLSRIKSLNYGDNILALMEARDLGADDAILLNTEGLVTCATASNIFIRERDRWTTPPVCDGVLPGITRAKLIKEKNAAEDSIAADRLINATEIFQCNSVIGLRAVSLR